VWPLLLAANRDERLDRAWDGPDAWWPDRPGVVAGRDRSGGGTWMAVRGSLAAAVLNRPGSLGPAPGKRSRGELPLLALDHEGAAESARAMEALDAGQWRSFNLVVADRESAWFICGSGAGQPAAAPLAPGVVHMVTAHDPDDPASPRVARHLPLLRGAPPPEPPDWNSWACLIADRAGPPGSAINVPPTAGFGTVCSSLLGIPAEGLATWLFAAGPGRVQALVKPRRGALTRAETPWHGGAVRSLL
jgi:hypothetical protein